MGRLPYSLEVPGREKAHLTVSRSFTSWTSDIWSRIQHSGLDMVDLESLGHGGSGCAVEGCS